MKVAIQVGLVVLSAAVLQRGVFSQLGMAGVVIEVLLIVAIAAGLSAGDQAGAITGFAAGLSLDLLHPDGPLGLFALTYAIVGWFVGRYQSSVVRSSRWLPVVAAVVATIGANVLYVVLSLLVDQRDLLTSRLLPVILVTSVGSAVLILPAVRVLRWAWDVQPDLAMRRR